MRARHHILLGLAAAALMLPSTGFGQSMEADEERIREISRQWVEAATKGDVEAIGALYAADGRFMAPNVPAAEGRKATQEAWQGFMKLPGVQLSFGPTLIRIAESGDIAYVIGTYEFSYDGEDGRVEDRGKYVDLWEKVDGDWKVKADIFNSDLPLPQQ